MTRITTRKRPGPTACARKAKAAKREREYRRICKLVDARDENCRYCHSARSLQHHHLRPRSLGRVDTTANIVLLCRTHHDDVGTRVGGRKLWIRALTADGADGPLQFISED